MLLIGNGRDIAAPATHEKVIGDDDHHIMTMMPSILIMMMTMMSMTMIKMTRDKCVTVDYDMNW